MQNACHIIIINPFQTKFATFSASAAFTPDITDIFPAAIHFPPFMQQKTSQLGSFLLHILLKQQFKKTNLLLRQILIGPKNSRGFPFFLR